VIYVQVNMYCMSITPKALQDLLDELEASRASRKRAWEVFQEIRWVLKDEAAIELPPPAKKTIDLEGRLVKDAVRRTIKNHRNTLTELVHAVGEFRKLLDPPASSGDSEYGRAVQQLDEAIERVEKLMP
jgi:hypothetical protein